MKTMITRSVMAVLILFTSFISLNAQSTFEKTFDINGDDVANDVRQTSDGGFIICGSVDYSAMSSGDVILIKTDANGDTLWTKMYGGIGADAGNSVLQTNDGGYIVAGSTNSWGAGSTDAYLIKTDASGNIQWSKTIGTPSGDAAYGIIQKADGGYVFSGYESSFLLNGQSHLVSTDAMGNVLWSKTYGISTRTNFSFALESTDEGGYVLGGYENQFLSNNYEYSLIKTDASGNLIWYKTIGDVDVDRNFTLARSNDGGFVVAGTNFTVSSSEINLVKVDANGVVVWTKKYGGIYNEFAFALTATSDGGFVFGGFSASFSPNNNNNAYFGKTDAAGNLLWSKVMDGTGYDIIYAIREASDGGLVLVGVKDEVAGVSGNLYFAKTDADGNTGCNLTVNSIVSIPPTIVGPVTANGTSIPTVTNVTPIVYGGANINTICASCSITATITPSGNVSFCSGTSLTLLANAGAGISYQWYRNGAIITGATDQAFTTKKGGKYSVTEYSNLGCSASSEKVVVTKLESPAATITPLGDLDICATGFVDLQANAGMGYSYQWLKGSNLIAGETNQIYTATIKGSFKVSVKADNGCASLSKAVKVTKSCKETDLLTIALESGVQCYPNPSNGQFTLQVKLDNGVTGNATLEIVNVLNQRVYAQLVFISDGMLNANVDAASYLDDGIYMIRLTTGNQVYSERLMIVQ